MGPRAGLNVTEQSSLPLLGIEPRLLCRPAHSLIAIPAPKNRTKYYVKNLYKTGYTWECKNQNKVGQI
jgi:hypothetical protein